MKDLETAMSESITTWTSNTTNIQTTNIPPYQVSGSITFDTAATEFHVETAEPAQPVLCYICEDEIDAKYMLSLFNVPQVCASCMVAIAKLKETMFLDDIKTLVEENNDSVNLGEEG